MTAAFERARFPIILMKGRGKSTTRNAILKNGSLLLKSKAITSSPNGARLYNDHAHPEYSTPECSSLFDLVAHDKSRRTYPSTVCRNTQPETRKTGAFITRIIPISMGIVTVATINYLMAREVPFETLKQGIMPFFITRQIFAGAGKIGI